MIEHYRTFTNQKYRLLTNLLFPILLAVLALICTQFFSFSNPLYLFPIFYSIYMIFEIASDYFGIGCICAKNTFGMNFLKTGYYGIPYFMDTVFVDLLVRPIRIALFLFLNGIPYLMKDGTIVVLLNILLFSSTVSVLSLNINRYIGIVHYVYLSAIFFDVLCTIVCVIIFSVAPIPLFLFLTLLLVASIYITNYHMNQKIKKSYMDL